MENVNKKFIDYQNGYSSIVEKLKNGHREGKYKEWKGFITINGPILFQPEILFIGINPGAGLFCETNYKNGGNKIPFRILNEEGSCYYSEENYSLAEPIYRADGKTIALDWFTRGNYRNGSSWYDLKTKHGNRFVENMIKIICNVANGLGKGEFNKGTKPEWYETFGKQIMFLNICPLATDNEQQLRHLKKDLNVNEWEDIVKPIRILVRDSIKPKVIVFAGVSAYNSFMWEDKGNTIFDTPVILIDRKRGYNAEKNLSNIANEIVKVLK